jgi:hypothetical protein
MDRTNAEKTEKTKQNDEKAQIKTELQKEGMNKAEQKAQIKETKGTKEEKSRDHKRDKIQHGEKGRATLEKEKSIAREEGKEKGSLGKSEKAKKSDGQKEKLITITAAESITRTQADKQLAKERNIRNSIMADADKVLHDPKHYNGMGAVNSSDSSNVALVDSKSRLENEREKGSVPEEKPNNRDGDKNTILKEFKNHESENVVIDTKEQAKILQTIVEGKKYVDAVASMSPEQVKYFNYEVASIKRDQAEQNNNLDRLDANEKSEAQSVLLKIREVKERLTYEGVRFCEYYKDDFKFNTTEDNKTVLELSGEGKRSVEENAVLGKTLDIAKEGLKDAGLDYLIGKFSSEVTRDVAKGIAGAASFVLTLGEMLKDEKDHRMAGGFTPEAREWQENKKLNAAASLYSELHPGKVRERYGITPGEDHRYDFAYEIFKDYKELQRLYNDLHNIVKKKYPKEQASIKQG